jgi:uncharacterized protein (TIGR02270 family)
MSAGKAGARTVPHIVEQHCEETAFLLVQRWSLLAGPAVGIRALGRLDERLAAHLDGLRVAGKFGRQVAGQTASVPGAAGPDLFAAAVLALEAGDLPGFTALSGTAPVPAYTQRGLVAALGWVSANALRGIGSALLDDPLPLNKAFGLYACSLHRVDPGKRLETALASADAALRACALHCAGEAGRPGRLRACRAALTDSDAGCRHAAARSAILLGDRTTSVDALAELAIRPGGIPQLCLDVLVKRMETGAVHALLKNLTGQPSSVRLVVRGAGLCGDPRYIPWLIETSTVSPLARLAGEAFCNVTGANLEEGHLNRPPPRHFSSGPTDNPADDDVAMDEDDGLPWPDPGKLQAWWKVNQGRFRPGVRYFMGAPPTVEHCTKVLREGYQRQRAAAAEYLCLLTPGTPLFPTSAPAWRQQRWLRQMG